MANLAGPLTLRRELSVPRPLVRMAAHDWLLVAYHLALFALAARAKSLVPLALILFDLGWLLAVLVLVRGLDRRGRLVSTFYRGSLVAIPVASYLQLRWILPVLAPESVDGALLAFDLRVFGVEPALSWDPWVTPFATEWFSFFYFSYFVLAAYVIPIALFADDGILLHEFTFGLLTVFCVGHLGYIAVPGLGPHVHVATFTRSLEGPFFWPLVRHTVASAGAGRDIFPSLHTAVPLFLAIFSFWHRDRKPFRYTWPVLAFFTTQIVVATMYLRWQWLADIVAGIVLAPFALFLAHAIVGWEERRRRRRRHAAGPAFAEPLSFRRAPYAMQPAREAR